MSRNRGNTCIHRWMRTGPRQGTSTKVSCIRCGEHRTWNFNSQEPVMSAEDYMPDDLGMGDDND